ncbi:MAG: preprotein translocase subunit SecG [Proteobacteria bacterium]|nr:preprotein translocase subunit SecG [Pseudomonadota bacterium]
MESVLLAVHLIVVISLAAVVLLQRSEGGGLGMGGGGNPGSFLTGRGQANLLTRTTAILGTAFFATSLLLSIIAARGRGPASILDTVKPTAPAGQSAPAPAAPAAPAQPGSVLDQLRGGSQPKQ